MSRAQKIALGTLALMGVLVAWVLTVNRQPPVLPADADHRFFESAAACMSCHGPDGESPREPDHVLGDDCLRCHGRP